jgi:release factor glutamine methyltransferase
MQPNSSRRSPDNRAAGLPFDLPVPELRHALAARFDQAGVPAPQAEAEWLLASILNVKRSALFLERRRVLSQKQQATLRNFFRRRLQREPLQYILGNCEFYGRELKVSRAVLIPRPETELLVQKVIELSHTLPAPRIVDLGAGSGCIAVTLALELPAAHVVAMDVSATALNVARENAQRWQVHDRLEFVQADMCALVQETSRFDLVVSNPPYVLQTERAELEPEVRDFEPQTALFVAGDGLQFYRCILKFCEARLASGGWVACEMASPRSAAIENVFRQSSFLEHLEIVHDYAGLPRHVIAQRRLP